MRKLLSSLLVLFSLITTCCAQKGQSNAYIRPPALSVSFSLYDYTTPENIRATSFLHAFRNKQFAKIRDMAPAIGLAYFQGLRKHIDFASSLNATFVSIALKDKPASSDNNFLLEADASVNLKMMTEQYWFNPYLIAGTGVSKYKSYYGAFIPLGVGIKINFFDEAAMFITTQYRIPVTPETANYHLVHSIGIAGVIGQKK